MKVNSKYGKLDENSQIVYAPTAVRANGMLVLNPTADDYRQAIDGPWLPVVNKTPEEDPGEGKHWSPSGWEEAEGEIRRTWVAVDDPPAPPRVFSKLKLYAAIQGIEKWDALEAWLKTQTVGGLNAYTAFSIAQVISDDHPMFTPLLEAAKTALDISDEQAEAILAASEASI